MSELRLSLKFIHEAFMDLNCSHDSCSHNDQLLCRCLRVATNVVESCVADSGAGTVREVTRLCGAGGGCMVCHRRIRQVIAEYSNVVAERGVCAEGRLAPAC